MAEDVLAEGARSGCVMGVGLDFSPWAGCPGPLRHVCRAVPAASPEEVVLIDDCSGASHIVRWG